MLKCIWKSSYLLLIFFLSSCISTTNIGSGVYSCSDKQVEKYNSRVASSLNIKYKAILIKENKKIQGRIKITESQLYINGVYSALGIEVFRLIIKQDSILYLDKINKNYYAGTIQNFPFYTNYKQFIPLFKSLILANVFDINSLKKQEDCIFYNSYDQNKIIYSFGNNGYITAVNIKNGASKYEIDYLKFNNKYKVPSSFSFSNIDGILLNFDFVDIMKFKSELLPISIPKNYTVL